MSEKKLKLKIFAKSLRSLLYGYIKNKQQTSTVELSVSDYL